MKTTEAPVIVEDSYDVPMVTVWKAITDLEEMKLWFFDNIDAFKPEIGSKSKFKVSHEGRTFTHLWEVTEVDEPCKIVYNWRYAEYPGNSTVSWELSEEAGKTKLVLITTVTEDFPDEVPEFRRESCQSGWEYFLCYRLPEHFKR